MKRETGIGDFGGGESGGEREGQRYEEQGKAHGAGGALRFVVVDIKLPVPASKETGPKLITRMSSIPNTEHPNIERPNIRKGVAVSFILFFLSVL